MSPTRRPSFRPVATALAAWLLVGAALTIASALAAALWSPWTSSDLAVDYDQNNRLSRRGYAARGRVPADWTVRTWLERRGVGLRQDTISESQWIGSSLGASASTAPNRTIIRLTSGWPLPCLQATVWEPGRPNASGLAAWWRRGIPVPRTAFLSPRDTTVPLRPLPASFAANSIILGGLAWSMLAVARLARSWIRRRHGRCPRCGYLSRGLTRCPECGGDAIGRRRAHRAFVS